MRCARCGKRFSVTGFGWGYTVGSRYACSYGCMRALEKEGTGITAEEKARVDELAAQGLSSEEICKVTGLGKQSVGTYLGKKRKNAEMEARLTAAAEQRKKEAETDEAVPEIKRAADRMRQAMRAGADGGAEWNEERKEKALKAAREITEEQLERMKEEQEAAREAVRETGEAVEMAAGMPMDEGTRREVIEILTDVLELLKRL